MGYTILIADDEPDIAGMLESYFLGRGYRVLIASDGAEAEGRRSVSRISSCWISVCPGWTGSEYAGASGTMFPARSCF